MLEAHRRSAARRSRLARPVGDQRRLRVHHVQPPRRGDRIGKLSPDLGDLGHRQEGGDRDQHQQRQRRRRDPAMQHERRTDRCNRQPAEAGRHLQAGGLPRKVVQQREPHRLIAPRIRHEFVAPPRRGLEGDQFGEALDRLGRVCAELSQRAGARWWQGRRCGACPVPASPPHRPGTAAARAPAARRSLSAPPERHPGSAPRRMRARRCGRRNTRPSPRPAWPARPDRRSGASADRRAPAGPACDTGRRASRPAVGTPCRAPGTIRASAAAPRAGAAASSNTTSSNDGAFARTAAMMSAPRTPTPMKATTRPMPQVTVTASWRRQGRMNPEQGPDGLGPADRGGVLREIAHHHAGFLCRRRFTGGASSSGSGVIASLRSPSCGPIRRRYGPSSAISSAWLPLCATAPSCSTRMRSALITLDRRCAKISVVRPVISRSSACWMTASFSASTDDSASSSTRIGASRSRARAMAMRWRWPPDSRAPRSPITV